ncbi:MAG: DJ-1/PfpI family protein [Rhizobiaceae bacterium]
MTLRLILWGVLALAVLSAAGVAGWLVTLPPAPAAVAPAPIADDETRATLAALKPDRERPLIAILGINDKTETTDYLMPYGILKRADVADVVALSTGPGPVTLYPALTVQADQTIAEFDAAHPDGADYVIVPAMEPHDDAVALAWIRSQSNKGATVIGVCVGATVVGAAGLLDGRQATTHWYSLDQLREETPSLEYVADRRFVADGDVATTTGITASMPMMLTLIEAIAGRARAESVAAELGIASWDARHASAAFRLNRPFAMTVLGNVFAFWNREERGIALTPGIDEVSLAMVADSWSRTYRSQAVTFAPTTDPVPTLSGLAIVPDRAASDWPADGRVPDFADAPPARALDRTLRQIAERYGERTADVVAMQLEYPRGPR